MEAAGALIPTENLQHLAANRKTIAAYSSLIKEDPDHYHLPDLQVNEEEAVKRLKQKLL